MPSLHVFPLDNLVLSTGLIMWIGHRKEIRKLTFHKLALRQSESAQIILLYFLPMQHTVFLETYPFYLCFSSSIFRFCRNKKRHSNKWCQALFFFCENKEWKSLNFVCISFAQYYTLLSNHMIHPMQIRLYKNVKDHKLHSPMLAFEYFTCSFIPNCTSNHVITFYSLTCWHLPSRKVYTP